MKVRKKWLNLQKQAIRIWQNNRKIAIVVILSFVSCLSIAVYKTLFNQDLRVYFSKETTDIETKRLAPNPKEIYDRQKMFLDNRLKIVESQQRKLTETIDLLNTKLDSNRKETPQNEGGAQPIKDRIFNSKPAPIAEVGSHLKTELPPSRNKADTPPTRRRFEKPLGRAIISFPVKQNRPPGANGISLPIGSYVKAKILSGVQAAEGRAVPVLLQADYAFIGPNKTKIDLAGCFLIAKSTGNLSIERVEMQATKLSCVSKSGRMFERDINGFIADDKDNSFAVTGKVSSKRERVGALAFLSSIVEGLGKATERAGQTTTTDKNGSSHTNVTGNEGRYIAAGGASNAAKMVTEWYLKQAQSLMPTIDVASGRDVWIITQSSLSLPTWYFKKNKQKRGAHVFSYFSSIVD